MYGSALRARVGINGHLMPTVSAAARVPACVTARLPASTAVKQQRPRLEECDRGRSGLEALDMYRVVVGNTQPGHLNSRTRRAAIVPKHIVPGYNSVMTA